MKEYATISLHLYDSQLEYTNSINFTQQYFSLIYPKYHSADFKLLTGDSYQKINDDNKFPDPFSAYNLLSIIVINNAINPDIINLLQSEYFSITCNLVSSNTGAEGSLINEVCHEVVDSCINNNVEVIAYFRLQQLKDSIQYKFIIKNNIANCALTYCKFIYLFNNINKIYKINILDLNINKEENITF